MVVCRGHEVWACRHKVCEFQVGFYVRVVAQDVRAQGLGPERCD